MGKIITIENNRNIDIETQIRVKMSIEKWQRRERHLKRLKLSLSELKILDEESQSFRLNELIYFEDNYELIRPEIDTERTNQQEIINTPNYSTSFFNVVLNLFNCLKSLLSLKNQFVIKETHPFLISELITGLDLDDSAYLNQYEFYPSLQQCEYYPGWFLDTQHFLIDQEIKDTRKQIEKAIRFLKIKIPITQFRRNLRNIIRMIHRFLFKESDDQYDLALQSI